MAKPATAPVLMVVGTASSVGKSVMVTALCRLFAQHGVRVAPFKAQNMSNNADVTRDGLEIGRAQSEQAAAARVEPAVEMNPVLLKPQGDRTSQLVLDGRPAGLMHSVDFIERKRDLWPHVERALARLREDFELVIVEGAGSPAEPNLREGDIVNMRVARHAGAVTLLVGDIDLGGVFAHLLGTLEFLTAEDRALIRGFVINRFRGDPSLLAPAIEELERRTGVPVMGVVPWIDDLRLAQEDAVALERPARSTGGGATDGEVDIAVIRLPRIANFDDFDPLEAEPGVRLRYVERPEALGRPDLLVIPGTKATIADLEWMRAAGLEMAVRSYAEAGGLVLGICGGYQMLGEQIADPHGVESAAGRVVPGIGLLPLRTTFAAEKTTRRASGEIVAREGPWRASAGAPVEGYEIHMGQTVGETAGESEFEPLLTLDGRPDGAVSRDGRVAGCYLHGLFANEVFRTSLLEALGRRAVPATSVIAGREWEFDRLAAVVREHLDIPALRSMLWP